MYLLLYFNYHRYLNQIPPILHPTKLILLSWSSLEVLILLDHLFVNHFLSQSCETFLKSSIATQLIRQCLCNTSCTKEWNRTMKRYWSLMGLKPSTYRDYSILCSTTNLPTHVHILLLAVNNESSFLPTAYFTYQHPLPLGLLAFGQHR